MTYKQTMKVWSGAVPKFLAELKKAASTSGVQLTSVIVEGGLFQSKVTFEVSGSEHSVRRFMVEWNYE